MIGYDKRNRKLIYSCLEHKDRYSCSMALYFFFCTQFLQDTKLYHFPLSVHLRTFRTETESVVGIPRRTLFVLYFYSKVGKFRYNFYLLIIGLNTENYERDKCTYLSDNFPSFMGSVMWIINTLHVFDLYSILSYTVLGELNDK